MIMVILIKVIAWVLVCVLVSEPISVLALSPSSIFVSQQENEIATKVFDFEDDACIEAANALIDQIEEDQAKGKPTVLLLFTGDTARIFYREFVALVKSKNVDLSTVITFNATEYMIPPHDPRSCRSFMNAELFDLVKIQPDNIHFLSAYDAAGKQLDKDALNAHLQEYERLLESLGGAGIAMLGIGENGHIGFAEPGSSVTGVTGKVALTPSTRIANKKNFGNDLAKVPEEALTIGLSTILKSKKIMVLAFGNNKQQAVKGLLVEPMTEELPASCLRARKDVTLYADIKALPSEISSYAHGKQILYQNSLALGFWSLQALNWMKRKFSILLFVTVAVAGIVAASIQLGPIAAVPAGGSVIFVLWRDYALNQMNPFRKSLTDKPKGDVVYGTWKDSGGDEWHYAQPAEPIDAARPIIVFDHGRDPFEFLSGMVSKLKDLFHIFAVFPYDIRYYWGDVKDPSSSFLSRCAKGMYLRQGKTLADLSTITSTGYANMPHWPFSNLDKFKVIAQGAVRRIHEIVQNKAFEPAKLANKMVAISYSVGARLRFIETVNEHVRLDEKTRVRTLQSEFDPKVRGLVLVNPFFSVSRIGNRYMRWQREKFWDPLARFMGVKTSAYDEMDRSFDLTKIHDRAKLAAQHKDWPQVVWITTQLDDPRLQPVPWDEFGDRLKGLKGVAYWRAYYGVAKDFLQHAKMKLGFAYNALRGRGNIPFYYWLGSIFVDPRGNDGIIDPDLGAGLDYHGKPLDPKAISIVVRGIAHDAMGEPLIQKLSFQLADLIADGVDLHHAHLKVSSEKMGEDGKKHRVTRTIYLSDHKPEIPIVLSADEDVEIYVSEIVPALENIGSKLLAEELLKESSPALAGKEWNAQPIEAMKILEFFKSALARKAWPLATEAEVLGPEMDLKNGKHTPVVAKNIFDSNPIAAAVLLEIWLAKGLLGVARIPAGQDAKLWSEFITYARDIAVNRSKSRWIANPFSTEELLRLHLADKKLLSHAPDLIWGIDYIEQFNDVLVKLVIDRNIWRDLAQSYEGWIESRERDFTQWIEKSSQATVIARELLGINNDVALETLWGQYKSGNKTIEELYAQLCQDRPRRLLQMLLTLDLKMPIGSEAYEMILSPRLDMQTVDFSV